MEYDKWKNICNDIISILNEMGIFVDFYSRKF